MWPFSCHYHSLTSAHSSIKWLAAWIQWTYNKITLICNNLLLTYHYLDLLIFCCTVYSKVSSEWLVEAQSLCKSVLRVTSSPSPANFDKDAVLLHQLSSALNLQLNEGSKLMAVSRTFVHCKSTYYWHMPVVLAPNMRVLYLCWTLHRYPIVTVDCKPRLLAEIGDIMVFSLIVIYCECCTKTLNQDVVL